MRSEYKIFRVFCVLSIVALCVLLITTGILTADYRTRQTVLGKDHEIIQVYQTKNGAVINAAGKISQIEPEEILNRLDILSYTLFAPVNNVIELIKVICGR